MLTWSAIAQLTVIAMSLGGYLFGANVVMAPDDPRPSHVFVLSVCTAAAVYAFLQLFTVVSTLSQIAYVTIDEANRESDDLNSP